MQFEEQSSKGVTDGRSAKTKNFRSPENIKAGKPSKIWSNKMQAFNQQLFILVAVAFAASVGGHGVEQDHLASHAYGPAIHISSGVLQLAPDTEPTQLLLVPNVYSSSLGNPWPHFFMDTLTASHLPHSSIPMIPATPSIHEPRIVVNDNVDFSQLKLPQHKVVHSHGR
ncbi:LOW QUALITY PROTEIN: uncharacterized protein LOC108105334 [Drosophila eugracilis]|uniref:LOW QUALITY PROTEIN: uncharacterized protein LOC108105334 n=1 Tax=Drosophila eugracilis TaxID=29029 RepID=UPI0007E72746|nr:LOW QUALITY PROTEIN: uncharacterized protein LOC108105334 [Drosophila eugracilis]